MARAGFGRTWLRLDANLGDLEPFNKRLSWRQRNGLTVALLMLFVFIFTLLDPLAAFVVLGTGLWVVWNRGNTVTRRERQVFLSVLGVSVFLGVVARVSTFLEAAGLLLLALLAYLWWVWRR